MFDLKHTSIMNKAYYYYYYYKLLTIILPVNTRAKACHILLEEATMIKLFKKDKVCA